MAPKDDKAPEAKTEEVTKAPEAAPAKKKVDPAVKELAERIFTQMCINHPQQFSIKKSVVKAHECAEAFLAYEPPAE